jgi:hypothetical protein
MEGTERGSAPKTQMHHIVMDRIMLTHRNGSFLIQSLLLTVFVPSLINHRWTVHAQNDFDTNSSFPSYLDICSNDLLASDANATDGFLSLYEYEVFVNSRYYDDCKKDVVVAESASQWEAFTVLACYSCLNDFVFIDTIPECCLPFNNSRIDIRNAASYENDTRWLTRLCDTADAAAVADECYTVAPTISPVNAPVNSNIDTTRFCESDIMAVDFDANETDGFLSRSEFRSLLDRMTNESCTVTNESLWVDAVYASLACASCQLASSSNGTKLPDLSCCTAQNASIAIAEAVYVVPEQRSVTQTSWLGRICTTILSVVSCNSTIDGNATTTLKPIAPSSNLTTAPIPTITIASNRPSIAPNNDTAVNLTTATPAAVAQPTTAPVSVDDGANASPTLKAPTSEATAPNFRKSVGLTIMTTVPYLLVLLI